MVSEFDINKELNKFHSLRPTNLQDMETIIKLKNEDDTVESKSDLIPDVSTDTPATDLAITSKSDSKVLNKTKDSANFLYTGLKNGCNKCWQNSTLQVLFQLEDFRNTVLNIENDTYYNEELTEKLEIINTIYENKSVDSTYEERNTDESLIIPALYSIFNNLNNYNNDNKKFYENLKEHFIFVENGNFIDFQGVPLEQPYNYNTMGSPSEFLYILNTITLKIKNSPVSYEQEIDNIFGYEKVEIYNSLMYDNNNLKIYDKYFNNQTKGFSNILTYINNTNQPLIDYINIDIYSQNLYYNKRFYKNFNNSDISINSNWSVNTNNFNDYLKNLDIESFLKDYFFNSFQFKAIDK